MKKVSEFHKEETKPIKSISYEFKVFVLVIANEVKQSCPFNQKRLPRPAVAGLAMTTLLLIAYCFLFFDSKSRVSKRMP